MRVLITGARGQLGSEIGRVSGAFPSMEFYYADIPEYDISNRESVAELFSSIKPDVVINCAAYTAVDKAESEPDLAFAVNGEGAGNIARACQQNGSFLIHVSTDFVFDGEANHPYKPDAIINPLSVYGRTKAAGEQLVLKECERSTVVRSSWLYSSFGSNFVKTMMRLGSERSELGVISDQYGCPTYAADLAHCLLLMAAQRKQAQEASGIYHYCNSGKANWFEFASHIMDFSGLKCVVKPIPTSAYPTPAVRPKYSVMDCSRIETELGIKIPDWRQSLKKCIELISNQNSIENMKVDVRAVIDIATKAGEEIMKIYATDFEVVNKEDDSPLTQADKASNEIIVSGLKKLYPDIPIISEESKQLSYKERAGWDLCWLVDPLDGTKEFIKKNGEFTVNIALIHNGKPVVGVVAVPAQGKMYFSEAGKGAFLIDSKGNERAIHVKLPDADKFVIVGSRSHPSKEMDEYLEAKKKQYKEVEFRAAGSALKICLVAEGEADVYPRLGPTMEWDTAAGHAVALEAGASVKIYGTEDDLTYNRENLLNPFFIVEPAG